MTTWLANPGIGDQPYGAELNALLTQIKSTIDSIDAGAGGATPYLHARTTALGMGTADDVALGGLLGSSTDGFFDLLTQDYTEAGLDRAGRPTTGIIPAGTWNLNSQGHLIVAPSGNGAADVHIYGQGAGATTLLVPDRKISGVSFGCMNSAQTMTAAARVNNTFTVTCGGPWFPFAPTLGTAPSSSKPLCQVGDVAVVKILDCGVPRWAHYTVTANHVGSDYTKVQYNAFAIGMAVDGCIPIVGTIYFINCTALQPLEWSAGHQLFVHNLTISMGSNTGTPLDGIPWRKGNRTFLEKDVTLNGGWCGEMVNGGPMPALSGYQPQNTDHANNAAVVRGSVLYNSLYVTNSQSGGGSTDGTGGSTRVGIGGGRDYWYRGCNWETPGLAHFGVADDGSLQTLDVSGGNFKSGGYLIFGEGIHGVQCVEDKMVDGLWGSDFKVESYGNFFLYDSTGTRQVWAVYGVNQRTEQGPSIDGAGNNTDYTDKPYHLTNVTISSAVLTGTVTETNHGLVEGTPVQIGAGGPQTTLTVAMTGSRFGSSLPAVIHCTNLAGFPASGTVSIASSTGTQHVTYTTIVGNDLHGCSGGKTNAVMTGGGSFQTSGVQSEILLQESAVQTLDATGQIITLPLPQYTGPDLSTPSTCMLGRIGFIKCGILKRFEWLHDWDLDGTDRYVESGMYMEMYTLLPGSFAMMQNDDAGGSARTLPTFLVKDAQPYAGTHATTTVTGHVFHTTEHKFSQLSVGRSITCANVAGGVDTIAAFVDLHTVAMTGAVTAGSGLTWSLGTKGQLDDPRVRLRRGDNEYRVGWHWPTDPSDVLAGQQVELVTSGGNTMKYARSLAHKGRLHYGTAMKTSRAGALVNVTTNGLTGQAARINIETATSLLTRADHVVSEGDDPTQLLATGTIAAAVLLADKGDGTVVAATLTGGAGSDPSPGQRIVGQSIMAAAGGTVGAYLCPAWWS